MARKKKVIKKVAKRVVAKSSVKRSSRLVHSELRGERAWFEKRVGSKDRWGFVPINWKGWVALILLVWINVFAANFFKLEELVLDNYLKMGVVFLLSIFVFIEFAKKKTKGVK